MDNKIIRIIDNELVIDFTKYRIIKINKKYAELKDKLNLLEQKKYDIELAMAEINKMIFTVKQEIDKLENEIIKDAGVK